MATQVTLRGVAYLLPDVGDKSWGDSLAAFLSAVPAATQMFLTFGNEVGNGGAGANTWYLAPVQSAAAMDSTERALVMPVGGVLRNLYVREGTPHEGNTTDYTVRKNGVDTALTLSTVDAVGTGNNTTNSVTVAAGDSISIKLVTTDTTVDPALIVASLTLSME